MKDERVGAWGVAQKTLSIICALILAVWLIPQSMKSPALTNAYANTLDYTIEANSSTHLTSSDVNTLLGYNGYDPSDNAALLRTACVRVYSVDSQGNRADVKGAVISVFSTGGLCADPGIYSVTFSYTPIGQIEPLRAVCMFMVESDFRPIHVVYTGAPSSAYLYNKALQTISQQGGPLIGLDAASDTYGITGIQAWIDSDTGKIFWPDANGAISSSGLTDDALLKPYFGTPADRAFTITYTDFDGQTILGTQDVSLDGSISNVTLRSPEDLGINGSVSHWTSSLTGEQFDILSFSGSHATGLYRDVTLCPTRGIPPVDTNLVTHGVLCDESLTLTSSQLHNMLGADTYTTGDASALISALHARTYLISLPAYDAGIPLIIGDANGLSNAPGTYHVGLVPSSGFQKYNPAYAYANVTVVADTQDDYQLPDDTDHGISAHGDITSPGDAAPTFQAVVIEEGDDDYSLVVGDSVDASSVIGVYDIRLSEGASITQGGTLTITFNIGDEYNGSNVMVNHKPHDADLETYEHLLAADGKVSVTVSSLSPFAVILEPNLGQDTPELPGSGNEDGDIPSSPIDNGDASDGNANVPTAPTDNGNAKNNVPTSPANGHGTNAGAVSSPAGGNNASGNTTNASADGNGVEIVAAPADTDSGAAKATVPIQRSLNGPVSQTGDVPYIALFVLAVFECLLLIAAGVAVRVTSKRKERKAWRTGTK